MRKYSVWQWFMRDRRISSTGKTKSQGATHVSLQDTASREVSHLQEIVIFLRIIGIWPDLAVNVGERIGGSVVGKKRCPSEADWPFDLCCQQISGWSCAAALNVRDLVILGNGDGNLKQYHRHSSARFCYGNIRHVSVYNSSSSPSTICFPNSGNAFWSKRFNIQSSTDWVKYLL